MLLGHVDDVQSVPYRVLQHYSRACTRKCTYERAPTRMRMRRHAATAATRHTPDTCVFAFVKAQVPGVRRGTFTGLPGGRAPEPKDPQTPEEMEMGSYASALIVDK